ncbi:GNAT family N-acetyltransferase [uncultured Dysosmobacter sp.]|uniref:GNAT family N-acetyltransferase n=1 Tax=uncultured Dysosmobacter sp. TaxID=2591384 RepID=UPI00260B845F|nr:GNAT family acetyltransferase [uncultured Dysosmobacter sp.]
MVVRQASLQDMDGIFALLARYHRDTIAPEDKPDGFVTTQMTTEQMTALIEKENGVTIAEKDGRIVAFALAAPWSFWAEWPLFAYMIQILPAYSFHGKALTAESTYQYGPVCVDKSVRGTGVFEEVFAASINSMKDRFPVMVTFINQINGRSYAAHTRKAGMTEVGKFDFNGNHYYMMSCSTDHQKQ